MLIMPVDNRPSQLGSPEYFSGEVWIDSIADAAVPTAAKSVFLHFSPGARTAWHTHPLGQTLRVTQGIGLAQVWGEPVQVIRPGDTVWFPPGQKHWHGATAKHHMTHLAIQEAQDGATVSWLEHVDEASYANAQLALTGS